MLILYISSNRYVGIKTNQDPHTYYVSGGFTNKDEAAERMSKMNGRLIELLRHLKSKYPTASQGGLRNADRARIVAAMLYNYNPERLLETDPRSTNDTSFTVGKGESTSICLRDKKKPIEFVDFNTLMFVALHELSHMGAYDVVGHPERFWSVFKFVLEEAAEVGGIYKPVDYAVRPIDYCGLAVDYNPLFDDALQAA